jgi:hypothetical protein
MELSFHLLLRLTMRYIDIRTLSLMFRLDKEMQHNLCPTSRPQNKFINKIRNQKKDTRLRLIG